MEAFLAMELMTRGQVPFRPPEVLVMLEYGCFLSNNLTTSCDGVEGCEAHWWWFGLALSILIISSLVQSFYYSGDCGSCGLCCLSLLQLSYLRDLCVALGGEEDTEENRRVMIRDVIVKMLESAPQLYLQSYILFVIGEHRNHLKLISIMFSALSLAVGVSKFVMWQFEDTRLLPKVAWIVNPLGTWGNLLAIHISLGAKSKFIHPKLDKSTKTIRTQFASPLENQLVLKRCQQKTYH